MRKILGTNRAVGNDHLTQVRKETSEFFDHFGRLVDGEQYLHTRTMQTRGH
jgi:hypothetical protein